MKRAAPLAVLAVITAAIVLWIATAPRRPDEPPSLPTAPVPTAMDPFPPLDPSVRRARPPDKRTGIRNALDRYIAGAGLDAQVKARERRRLVVALARLRKAARRIEHATVGRRAAEQRYQRAIADTDALFRDKLGIGVETFLAAQDAPGHPAPAAR